MLWPWSLALTRTKSRLDTSSDLQMRTEKRTLDRNEEKTTTIVNKTNQFHLVSFSKWHKIIHCCCFELKYIGYESLSMSSSSSCLSAIFERCRRKCFFFSFLSVLFFSSLVFLFSLFLSFFFGDVMARRVGQRTREKY